MANVVIISDSEDADDCVIESVIFVEDDTKENNRELCHEVRKENILLAQFIDKCLTLENTNGMMEVLKGNLLESYYKADKSARESPKFQKNLRRANHLLNINPEMKYNHIKDLCNILDTFKVKKKVPFVTLATNLDDKNCEVNELKRCSPEKLDAVSGNSKKTRCDGNHVTHFNESLNISFNDTSYDTLNESQQSCLSEEDLLLVEKKSNNFDQTTPTDRKIRIIESKICFYKKRIAALDEQEVDDDSVNSPYIRSEKFKTKIVNLHKELCQLRGNKTMKRTGLRLKLIEGHPPGPTKMLERFLNRNFNSNGEPSFPDFLDVVTCVSEANEKDKLGWTKAQIMKEASFLFTLCGCALQKRRQIREYRDLMYRVKLKALDKDPADEDPRLQAQLEENRRLAIKKESDILEKYTMMQYLPPKPKRRIDSANNENTGQEKASDGKMKANTQREIINNNNNNDGVKNESENKSNESGNNSNEPNVDVPSQESQDTTAYHSNIKIAPKKAHADKKLSDTILFENVGKKVQNAKHRNNVENKTIVSNGTSHRNSLSKFKHKNGIPCNNSVTNIINDNNVVEKDEAIANRHQKLGEVLIEGQVKQKSDQNVIGVFDKLGNDFTVTIEIISDS